MLEKLSEEAVMFQYGDEPMTFCVCDEDGRIDQNAPMATAQTHWLYERAVVDKDEWNEMLRFINEDVTAGDKRIVLAFFGEEVYDVKPKVECENYVGVELTKR